jgi:hypothetical protein
LRAATGFVQASRNWPCRALPYVLACFVSACAMKESDETGPPSARCAGCHLKEYEATTHPPHRGVRPTTCAVCHGETSWHPARSVLVHSFPLEGAHAKTACFNCHGGSAPTFEGTTKLCVDCHHKDQAAANLRIAHHSTFPSQCQTCHTTSAWKPTLPDSAGFAQLPGDGAAAGSASVAPEPEAVSSGAKPRQVKKVPSGAPAWPSQVPGRISKPDQVSGASRVEPR